MAKSILDIVIKLSKQGGADKETVKELVNLKSTIMNTAAVAGTLVAAGYAVKGAFDATVGALIDYADKVRNISNATGATAEDASKLIQILDDQKVSYEQLEQIVAKNGKTFDYSIAGIATMSEEYLKLTDANEQAAYMQERFGKQWISFVPTMKQGGQAIRDAADAVDKNLVLTEKAIVQTRMWEIQMDNLIDKMEGFKIAAGQGVLGVLDGSTAAIQKNAQAIFEAANGYYYNTDKAGRYSQAQRDAWEEAKKQAEQEWIKANALDESAESTDAAAVAAKDYTEILKEQSKANQDLLGLIGKVSSADQSYEETAKQLADERITIEQERAAAISQGWWEGSEKIREYDLALDENAQKVEENANKHHEAMGRIQYDLLVTKLSADGLTDAEYQIAQQAGLMFGVFDQASVSSANSMNAVTQAVTDGTLRLQDMQAALDMMKKGYTIDVVLRVLESMATTDARMDSTQGAKVRHGGAVGFAGGGVATGPNSGHWELLHGDEAVIPLQNGSVPVQMSGSNSNATSSPVYVNLTISSPVTVMDEQKAQNVLLPLIVNGIKQARIQGAIK